jgi:hypothetical protein
MARRGRPLLSIALIRGFVLGPLFVLRNWIFCSLAFFICESQASDQISLSCQKLVSKYQSSLLQDIRYRLGLPQTDVARHEWSRPEYGDWGPPSAWFPPVHVPHEFEQVAWLRHRVIEVARYYIGLDYVKSHIPQRGGLDCSNFTAWVYNFGLGLKFSSNIEVQSETAGRKLAEGEALAPGDLIFLWNRDHSQILHVTIYVDEEHVIDSTRKGGVELRARKGWYNTRFAWARRLVE